jgi:hypothetical protein
MSWSQRAICPWTVIAAGRALGTHFIWHLIYMLLMAAIRFGRSQRL